MARIDPGGPRQIGLGAWAFARIAGRVTGTEPPAIFTTLGRGRRLFWGWLHFAAMLMPLGTLSRRESELVILRVATLRECAYEFEHHTRLGRRAGIDGDDLDRVQHGSSALGWTERERILLRVAEELVGSGDVADATWKELRAVADERTAIELLLLVGHYSMLATTLMTLRLSPDRPR